MTFEVILRFNRVHNIVYYSMISNANVLMRFTQRIKSVFMVLMIDIKIAKARFKTLVS